MKFNTFTIICGKCGEIISPELIFKSFGLRFIDDGLTRTTPAPLDLTDSSYRHICSDKNSIEQGTISGA